MSDPTGDDVFPASSPSDTSLGFTMHGTQGPVIAVTHGWAADSNFTASIPALFPQYRVMLIDLPGYGRSRDLGDYADFDDTVALLKNTIPQGAVLMSWSLSTLYALRLCSLPESPVSRLITVCGAARFPDEPDNPGFAQKYIEKLRLHFRPESAEKLLRLFYSIQSQGQCGEVIREAFAKFRMPDFHVLYTGLQHMFYADERAALAGISIPTLRLYGQKDLLVPATQAALYTGRPGDTVRTFPDSAHLPFISESNAFAAAVNEFLSKA